MLEAAKKPRKKNDTRRGSFIDSSKKLGDVRTIFRNHSAEPSACGGEREGVVVRLAGRIADANWSHSIAKWVRKNHIQCDPGAERNIVLN